MAETFGKIDKGGSETLHSADRPVACKYTSGSAGDLATMSMYVLLTSACHMKCALYDSNKNYVENGTTEDKSLPSDQDGWVTFDFLVSPTVLAATVYYLCWWTDGLYTVYYDAGSSNQAFREYGIQVYNGWPASLAPYYYMDREYSIYATYEEAPSAKKTLVQAALISIPPLIVLPTLAQILKITGG